MGMSRLYERWRPGPSALPAFQTYYGRGRARGWEVHGEGARTKESCLYYSTPGVGLRPVREQKEDIGHPDQRLVATGVPRYDVIGEG